MKSLHKNKVTRVGPEKGYGPRHAFNAQEGDDDVPMPDNFGPGWQLKRALHSARQKVPGAAKWFLNEVRSGILSDEDIEEIKNNPVSPQSMMALANAAIMLNPEFAGRSPGKLPGIPKMPKPGLKVHDPAPRYEGPEPPPEKYIGVDEVNKQFKDKTFPSLDKPPYDALKEPPLKIGDQPKGQEIDAWNEAFNKYAHGELLTPEEAQLLHKWESVSSLPSKYLRDFLQKEHGLDIPEKPYDFNKWQEQVGKGQGQYEEPPLEPTEQTKNDPGWTGKTPHPDEVKYWHEMTPEEKAKFNADLDKMSKNDLMGIPPEPPPKAQDALDKLKDAIEKKFPELKEPQDPAEFWKDMAEKEIPEPPPGMTWDELDALNKQKPPKKPSEWDDPNAPDLSELEPLTPEQEKLLNEFGYGKYKPPPEEPFDPDSPDYPGPNRWDYLPPEGMKKGKSKVHKIGAKKGFGPRHAENAKEGDLTQINTDTVPAMLTPREAVLNRNAAELAGRDKIEALNQQGNELARKGVDLAAQGDKDVPDRKKLAGTGAESYLTRQLLEKYSGSPTAFELVPDFIKALEELSGPTMAAKGLENVPDDSWLQRESSPGWEIFNKLRYLLDPSHDIAGKVKEAYGDLRHLLDQFTPGKSPQDVERIPRTDPDEGDIPPVKDRSQSYPRVQNDPYSRQSSWADYMKFLQTAPPDEPGMSSEDTRSFLESLQEKPLRPELDRMVIDPDDPLPPSRYVPERPPERLKKGTKDMKPKPKSGSPYAEGYQKLQGGDDAVRRGVLGQPGDGASLGGMQSPMPGLNFQHRRNMVQQGPGLDWQHRRNAAINAGFDQPAMPPSGVNPNQIEPPGNWQAMPAPLKSAPFYPPGQGLRMAEGESDILGGGESIYGKSAPVNLTAPNYAEMIKALIAGQTQGLSPTQVQGLMKAFQGFQQGYGAATGGIEPGTDPVGYSGGISDIGYPPFIGPNMDYHADKGSWTGAYDPMFMIPQYARGTSNAGIRGNQDFAGNTRIGGIDIPPADMNDPFGREPIFGPDLRLSWMGGGRMGFQPPPWAQGFSQGPTRIPTTLGNSGYPMAVPASSDWNRSGSQPKTPPKNKE